MIIKKIFSAFVMVLCVIGLILIRHFETTLFYDPLHGYFHSDFQNLSLPDVHAVRLIAHTSMRYIVNTVLSIGVLWFLFKQVRYIKACLWVYLFVYVVLLSVFVVLLQIDAAWVKMLLFYIRRFLIHPVLLFVLIAGGYYVKSYTKHK